MTLILKRHLINNIEFTENNAQPQGIQNGVLTVDKNELKKFVLEDERLQSAEFHIARPGESKRILPVKDIIEPRTGETRSCFPGVLNKLEEGGKGEVIVLQGCAVVSTGPIVGFQEGLIDMSGPGAKYNPFSQLINLAMVLEKKINVDPHDHEEAVRIAGLKVADYLAQFGRGKHPDETEILEWGTLKDKTNEFADLPKVGYVCLCTAQGLLHDNYFYGKNCQQVTPQIVSPLEIMDGALISGNCVSPGSKTTTYHHLNNAIIKECFNRHGKSINFYCMMISPMRTTLNDKIRNSIMVGKTMKALGVDSTIISMEGFGNPTTDLMMTCRELESRGIQSVLLTNEDAGANGFSESLPDGTPEANAIVSTGNSNETILLPPMDEIIGNLEELRRVTGGSATAIQEDGSLLVEIHGIMGSHNLQGFGYLSARTV